jgi:stage III sporulation protein AA
MSRELVLKHFRGSVRLAIEKMSESDFSRCQEIRLRVDRSLSVFAGNENYSLTSGGILSLAPGAGVIAHSADIKFCFESICEYSVHSFSREIRAGYITVPGGHRAGFCGTAVAFDEHTKDISTVKNIGYINFRIAREVKGAADKLIKTLRGQANPSVLICGSVGSGKTTLLRDFGRQSGERMKVALIDCRGELAAVSGGVPAHDVGTFTDVFDGYDKATGIETAVRVMSPSLIVCDEIGDERDIKAMRYANLSGVSIAASIHAKNIQNVWDRGIPFGMFDYAVFLKGSQNPAEIECIEDLKKGA